ncbi:MAG: hypothetical protein FWB98_08320 [Defluviitaleaceae bacterium]|nr:hypothetical protein [Defluviitaleaceae bacterium]
MKIITFVSLKLIVKEVCDMDKNKTTNDTNQQDQSQQGNNKGGNQKK